MELTLKSTSCTLALAIVSGKRRVMLEFDTYSCKNTLKNNCVENILKYENKKNIMASNRSCSSSKFIILFLHGLDCYLCGLINAMV